MPSLPLMICNVPPKTILVDGRLWELFSIASKDMTADNIPICNAVHRYTRCEVRRHRVEMLASKLGLRVATSPPYSRCIVNGWEALPNRL